MTDSNFKELITILLLIISMGGIVVYFIFVAIRTRGINNNHPEKPSARNKETSKGVSYRSESY